MKGGGGEREGEERGREEGRGVGGIKLSAAVIWEGVRLSMMSRLMISLRSLRICMSKCTDNNVQHDDCN